MIALWIILAALAAAAVILIAAGMLIPQAETRRMKGVITAHLLALRLYRHDLDQCLAEMLGLIKTIPAYFVKTLPALLAGLFIIAPSLKWLDDYFAFRPLRANETAILQVVLTPEAGRDIAGMNISLKAPEGMVVETPVLRIPELRELNWRVRALRDMNEAQFTPHINREMNFVKIDLKKTVSRAWGAASAPPFPIKSFRLAMPRRELAFFGYGVNWLMLYFVILLISVESGKRIFNVAL